MIRARLRRSPLLLSLLLLPALLSIGSVPLAAFSPAAPIARVWVRDLEGAGDPSPVVTFGQAFRAGEVPDSVVAHSRGEALATQVDVKRRHPDGSVRHAVLSVLLPAGGAHRVPLDLVPAAAANQAGGLEIAAALEGGFDAVVEVTEGGVTYSARATELLARSPVARWLDGPLATEVRARGPLTGAGREHPSLLALFDIRFLAAGQARVSIALENTWSDAAEDLEYGVRMWVSGRQAFAAADVVHPRQTRWRRVLTWGEVPSATVVPDLAHLISTGAVPTYDLASEVPSEPLRRLHRRWRSADRSPFGLGILPADLARLGGEPLPEFAALGLLAGDPVALRITADAADRAGAFAVHYRNRGTGRVQSPAADPGFRADRAVGPVTRTDTAHQPSLAFLPYLLSGDPYHLDELYFWSSYNLLALDPAGRGGAGGLLAADEPQGQAWSLRTLAQAAWVAPEAHVEATDLAALLRANLDWYESFAAAGPAGDASPALLAWCFDYLAGLGHDTAALRERFARAFLDDHGRAARPPACAGCREAFRAGLVAAVHAGLPGALPAYQRIAAGERQSDAFAWALAPGGRIAPTRGAGGPLAPLPAAAASACASDERTICLAGGRFRARVTWKDHDRKAGTGQVVPLGSDDSGLFWFFDRENWEMLIKVLNGCGVNGHYWVFAAASTDVHYSLTVTDTVTGKTKQYANRLGRTPAAVTDAKAFAVCP